jgi:hypothetical protein
MLEALPGEVSSLDESISGPRQRIQQCMMGGWCLGWQNSTSFCLWELTHLGDHLKMAYLFSFSIALMFQTAALKPAYQTTQPPQILSTRWSVSRCLSPLFPSPAAQADGPPEALNISTMGHQRVHCGCSKAGESLAKLGYRLSLPQQHLLAMTSSQHPGWKLLWKGGDQITGVLH